MRDLDLFDFYQKVLIPLTPPQSVNRILEVVMAGAETNDDFANVLTLDTELQHWVRLTVKRLGFDKRANKLNQMTVLLGQNRIRDLILGRIIERSYLKESQTVLGKILLEIEKSKAKDPKKPMPQTGAPNSEGAAVATDAPEAEEIIPPIDEFRKHLDYSTRAEEVAISIRNSYPGQAFAGGVIFDFVAGFLQNRDFGGVSDSRLKNAQNYLAEIFSDGIRCGVAANEIMQKISISHQKNAFVTALVHNIGKALLFTYDPKAFERAFVESTGAKDAKNRVDSAEAESIEFEFDHAQIGSLYLGRLPFLEEIERSVDYHHNPHLLKFANPKLYALACVLRVSGALAKLYQSQRSEDPDVEQLKDQKLVLSKDFQFLQLNQIDWLDIKSNYALKLMKIGY